MSKTIPVSQLKRGAKIRYLGQIYTVKSIKLIDSNRIFEVKVQGGDSPLTFPRNFSIESV